MFLPSLATEKYCISLKLKSFIRNLAVGLTFISQTSYVFTVSMAKYPGKSLNFCELEAVLLVLV